MALRRAQEEAQTAKPAKTRAKTARPKPGAESPETGKPGKRKPAGRKAAKRAAAKREAAKREAAKREAARLVKAKRRKAEAEARPPEPAPAPFSLQAAIAVQMKAAEDALSAPDAGDAIHESRIALKRLRVLARVADYARPQAGAALELTAQAAMKRLAPARDLAALEHAAAAVAQDADGEALAFLTRAAGEFSRSRRAAESAALREAEIALLRIGPIVAIIPEITRAAARRASADIAARARSTFKAAHGKRKILLRHAWRKREKDRRNAEMLLGAAWKGARRRKIGRDLTDALGRERDAMLLLDRLSASPRTPKAVLRLIKRHRRLLAQRADYLGAKLHAA
jgi:CHAD domain-containing protein